MAISINVLVYINTCIYHMATILLITVFLNEVNYINANNEKN